MRKLVFLFLLAALAAVQTSAQTLTTVTGKVIDSNNTPYSGARMTFSLVSPGGPSPSLTPCTGPAAQSGCPIQNPGAVTLDSGGNIPGGGANLWANASILPAGTTYTITAAFPGIPPPVGTGPQVCTVTGITVAGANFSISTLFSGFVCPPISTVGFATSGAPNGANTFNVQNTIYGASGTTRKITGSYGFTNPGTTGPHVVTVNSGGTFLASDVGSQLDCYSTLFNLNAINSSLVTAVASTTSITVTGTASNSTGSAAQVCAVGGKDDTAAIVAAQAALAAAPYGGSLYFPCGGYLVTSHLAATLAGGFFPANSQAVGEGSSCVSIFLPGDFAWATTSSPLFNISGNSGTGSGTKVKGITIDGMSQNNTVGSVPPILQGGQFEDVQILAITTVNACINGSTDNNSNMTNMRANGALCGGLGYPMTLTAHGGALINPQIKANGFNSAEPDISIVGGFIFGPVGLTSQGAANTAVQINGTRINGPLNLASHGGAFIAAANVGPCGGQAGSCLGTENSNGINLDATSNVYITNSNLSAGGAGKAAISMVAGSVATIGPGVSLTVTNSAVPFIGQGTIIADGHSVNGACTGVATASSTLGLFGTGPNETLTTCTSVTIGSGIVMQRAGTLMGLIANASAAGVNASSGVVTVLKNGGATTITCTFGTTTACNDGTHTVAFVAGDLISLQFTTQAADTLAGVKVSVIWL